jgi:hypothetical protein
MASMHQEQQCKYIQCGAIAELDSYYELYANNMWWLTVHLLMDSGQQGAYTFLLAPSRTYNKGQNKHTMTFAD